MADTEVKQEAAWLKWTGNTDYISGIVCGNGVLD